jgi:phosphoglycerol transferase MdoB-like AlkP superfamily enzyme
MRSDLRPLIPFAWLFMCVQVMLRLFLFAISYHTLEALGLRQVALVFFIGMLFDLSVLAAQIMVPMLVWVCGAGRLGIAITFGLWCFALCFTAVAEWLFWDEFLSRFNFIAVDYLVYTHEVIGNIWESYPILPIISAQAIISVVAGLWYFRRMDGSYVCAIKKRIVTGVGVACAASIALHIVASSWGEVTNNQYANQIARNGTFELFAAYKNNELDFDRFYVSQDAQQSLLQLRKLLSIEHKADAIIRSFTQAPSSHPYGQCKNCNLIIITVESLSASFLKHFGNQENLTPHLDALIERSLLFNNLYAIGTRTVYGLAAINLSIPPLPGNSIVRRPNNDNLYSLASILNENGYKSGFIYGGHGYFDNMNAFFAGNGYNIVDRADFTSSEISFSNIWGVCDEDLFHKAIQHANEASNTGRPFFHMIMTTSNHRPFTYPEGKIDIPPGTGRAGGVKYSDYAIGQFIEQASNQPWFANTMFVIVADHTAGSAGKEELSPNKYLIPFIIFAPGKIKPGVMISLASQIDVAPTVLGLLGMEYESAFFGENLLHAAPGRAFISNYQKLGFLTADDLLVLKPVKQLALWKKDFDTGEWQERGNPPTIAHPLVQDALAYYQTAAHWRKYNHITPLKQLQSE